jgi:hypothetical protein
MNCRKSRFGGKYENEDTMILMKCKTSQKLPFEKIVERNISNDSHKINKYDFINITELNQIESNSLYTSDINNKFEEYNNTNNGIILLNSKLIFELFNIKLEGGGGCFDFLKTLKFMEKLRKNTSKIPKLDEDFANELIDFCNQNSDNSGDILKKYIENNDITIIAKYNKLKDFIDKNNNSRRITMTFDITPIIKKEFNYEYYDYNKDILFAYESKFIENIENTNKYIKKQYEYLIGLSNDDRSTIRDFINGRSFAIYKLYKTNEGDWTEEIKYLNSGSSFLSQIRKLGLNTDLTKLTIDNWIKILETYSNDLDNIINNSPELEDDIYCYRGVSKHYIDSKKGYKLNEHTSFSLSFFSAYDFYKSTKPDSNPCMYRTTILKGSKALFVQSLTNLDEMEIIVPANSIILSNDKEIEDYYNNINNRYDICSSNSIKFKSLDLIIKNDGIVSIINNKRISIVTANIHKLSDCNSNNDKIKKLIDKLISNNPDIICIQESKKDIFNKHMISKGYILIASNNNEMDELIEIYKIEDIRVIVNNIKLLNTEKCNTLRTDIIIDLNYNDKDLKIGVVHTCGGGIDDTIINGITRDELSEIKKENIQKMIDDSVDIILGDFNSDYGLMLCIDNPNLTNYFNGMGIKPLQMIIWNISIYELLESKGYKSFCNSYCKKLYTNKKTSKYGSSPDVIYYKENNIKCNAYEIIELINDNGETYSDHNGIYANLII